MIICSQVAPPPAPAPVALPAALSTPPAIPEPVLKHVVAEQNPIVPEVNVAPVHAVDQLTPDSHPAEPVKESLELAASSWGK